MDKHEKQSIGKRKTMARLPTGIRRQGGADGERLRLDTRIGFCWAQRSTKGERRRRPEKDGNASRRGKSRRIHRVGRRAQAVGREGWCPTVAARVERTTSRQGFRLQDWEMALFCRRWILSKCIHTVRHSGSTCFVWGPHIDRLHEILRMGTSRWVARQESGPESQTQPFYHMPPAQPSPAQPSSAQRNAHIRCRPRSVRHGDAGSPDESPRLRVVYGFVAVVLLDGATPILRPSQIPRILSGPFLNFFYQCLLIFTPLLHSNQVLERSPDR